MGDASSHPWCRGNGPAGTALGTKSGGRRGGPGESACGWLGRCLGRAQLALPEGLSVIECLHAKQRGRGWHKGQRVGKLAKAGKAGASQGRPAEALVPAIGCLWLTPGHSVGSQWYLISLGKVTSPVPQTSPRGGVHTCSGDAERNGRSAT